MQINTIESITFLHTHCPDVGMIVLKHSAWCFLIEKVGEPEIVSSVASSKGRKSVADLLQKNRDVDQDTPIDKVLILKGACVFAYKKIDRSKGLF